MFDAAYSYDTHGDRNAADIMAKKLNDLVDAKQRLVALAIFPA